MNTLPFTDKSSYFTWRAHWCINYAALSERIRELKAQRKDRDATIRSVAQHQAWACRKRAQQMLEERKQSKVQAQAQYRAAKATAAQAT